MKTAPSIIRCADNASLRPFAPGPEVVRLQILLRAAGYELEPDGRFGPMTRECVKSFQAARGIRSDGTVGPKTWDALEEVMPLQEGGC